MLHPPMNNKYNFIKKNVFADGNADIKNKAGVFSLPKAAVLVFVEYYFFINYWYPFGIL